MLLERYLQKELLRTLMATTLILMLVAISNKLVRFLSQAATGNVPTDLVLYLVMCDLPNVLSYLLPLCLLLAILLTYGRFYVDNEATVMQALGVPWSFLLSSALKVGFLVMVVVGLLSLWIAPWSDTKKENLLRRDESLLLMQTLAPGRFHTMRQGELVFYVGKTSGDRTELREVFIAEQPKHLAEGESQVLSVLIAQSGAIEKDKTGAQFLVIHEGARYEGMPGQTDYQIVEFETYGRKLSFEEPNKVRGVKQPTTELLVSKDVRSRAELQWRLSLPLSVPLLVMFATPLARVNARAGRFSKLLPAVVFFIVYFNGLTICKRWIVSGKITPTVGMWWLHALVAMVAIFLCLQASGALKSWLSRFKPRSAA